MGAGTAVDIQRQDGHASAASIGQDQSFDLLEAAFHGVALLWPHVLVAADTANAKIRH
ncbi:hypothetical protein ACFY3V_34850 [Streptosporangium sp. NPDC000095]|uniref:hypothetical protein n=1 Tax=Streptosporangium sp. NPDC000095 TaxID=3366184 RepID=UPI003694833A